MNHPNFPYGKGLWIWNLPRCFGGNLDTIIAKCKEVGLSYVLVKSGDGVNTWSQWNRNVVDKFHAAGLKVYSWTFVYGDNPVREAAVAMWSLDMGSDGHVFDAEGQYAGKYTQAETMMKAVRSHSPNAFLAHSPMPIIDYHSTFPYVQFGKYCDAVMPQMYFGDFNKSPEDTILWTFEQWKKWEKKWADAGNAEAIKPIIPAGQAYSAKFTNDKGVVTREYKSNGKDVAEFIAGVHGYKSVNFWSFEHILSDEVWEAIKNTNVDPATVRVPEPAIPVVEKPEETKPIETVVEHSTVPEVVPAPPVPTVVPDPEPAKIEPVVNAPTATEAATPGPVKETTPEIWGINSHNSISYRVKKRHVDYFLDFVNLILRLIKL